MSNEVKSTTASNAIVFLRDLSGLYQKLGEQARVGAFAKAAAAINSSGITEIVNAKVQLSPLAGVGPSTVKEIEQFMETGTSDRRKALEVRVADTGQALENAQESIDAFMAMVNGV